MADRYRQGWRMERGDRNSGGAVPSPGGLLTAQWKWLEPSPCRGDRSRVRRNILVFFYINLLVLRR